MTQDHDSLDHGGSTADVCFELLQHWQRRFVLVYLQRNRAPIPVRQLARDMAAEREAVTMADATIRLHHVHLPKLAAADLVTYDRFGSTVAPSSANTAAVVGRVGAAVDSLSNGTEGLP